MRIVQLTPGSGDNFYCENCLRDRDLMRQLRGMGIDAMTVPLYLPPTGWGAKNSDGGQPTPIFYGGINVYFQQVCSLFRRTPRWVDRLLDSKPLLKLAGRLAGSTDPQSLGDTTLSMLAGEHGRQRKELDRLTDWLLHNGGADVVVLSNLLLIGLAERLGRDLDAAVVCLMQDEDEFLDELPDSPRQAAWQMIAERAERVDRFVAASDYYRQAMIQRLGLGEDRVDVAPVGLGPADRPASPRPADPPVVGYLSRMTPPKGVDVLIEALGHLARLRAGKPRVRCRLAGGATGVDKPFVQTCQRRAAELGVDGDIEWLGHLPPDATGEFLASLTALSVPARRGESSGRYVLEGWAAGVPAVQPASGVFPELLAGGAGGVLVEPENPQALAEALAGVLDDPARVAALGDSGRDRLVRVFGPDRMAENVLAACQKAQKAQGARDAR